MISTKEEAMFKRMSLRIFNNKRSKKLTKISREMRNAKKKKDKHKSGKVA